MKSRKPLKLSVLFVRIIPDTPIDCNLPSTVGVTCNAHHQRYEYLSCQLFSNPFVKFPPASTITSSYFQFLFWFSNLHTL
jgi:hypothetical protein